MWYRYTIAVRINCKGPKTIYVRVVLIRGIEKWCHANLGNFNSLPPLSRTYALGLMPCCHKMHYPLPLFVRHHLLMTPKHLLQKKLLGENKSVVHQGLIEGVILLSAIQNDLNLNLIVLYSFFRFRQLQLQSNHPFRCANPSNYLPFTHIIYRF